MFCEYVITICNTIDELKKEIARENSTIDLETILKIDFPFMEHQDTFTIINIPAYHRENTHNIIFMNDNATIVYSETKLAALEQKFKMLLKKKHGESTRACFVILKSVLKNYSSEFEKIRDVMNILDLDPVLDSIEEAGRTLRKLTDRLEGLLQVIIEIKEEEIEHFDTTLISFDYEMLNTETRYWLERCRSHMYRIASLRTKSEMKSNKELNDTMSKLTVIMTFLTIVSIVVSVPGTIGAIFGIPALSDVYFKNHTTFLLLTLIITTLLSIVLGLLYWKSLGLNTNKSN